MPTAETSPAPPRDVEDLEERLSRPTPEVVADLAAVAGDIMVLGVGGKMGPTLARMARRAAPERRILAVARFSDPAVAAGARGHGVEPIRADLLDRAAIARLPRVPNVILMAGHKFGTSDAPSRTWATNTILPVFVAEAMADSRIVAFSTGNVYPFVRSTPAGRRRTSRSCRHRATTPRAASGASGCCAGTPRRAARRA